MLYLHIKEYCEGMYPVQKKIPIDAYLNVFKSIFKLRENIHTFSLPPYTNQPCQVTNQEIH